MDRRKFLRTFFPGLLGAGLCPSLALANHPKDKRPLQFVFAQIKYRGGDWSPHPLSVTPLMEELMARTSVEAAAVRHEVTLTDNDLFNYPFLYLAGKYDRLAPTRSKRFAAFFPTAAFCSLTTRSANKATVSIDPCAVRCKKSFRETNSSGCPPAMPH
jgi:hypothetical protein